MESTAVYALGSIFCRTFGDEVLSQNFWTECLSLWWPMKIPNIRRIWEQWDRRILFLWQSYGT